jgi:hypothetical protein
VWLNDAPFATAMAPFVKPVSVPVPPDVPLHAPLAHRVTVCCTPDAFTQVTVLPSEMVIDAGEKQNSAPPQPVDWIVTVGSDAAAVDPAGEAAAPPALAARDPKTSATDANSPTSEAPNLRMSPPPRASAFARSGRDCNALHTYLGPAGFIQLREKRARR